MCNTDVDNGHGRWQQDRPPPPKAPFTSSKIPVLMKIPGSVVKNVRTVKRILG